MQQAEIDAFQFVGQDIPWLLNHWAAAAPDRPFLVWEPRSGEDRTWTYRQFVDDVEKVASALVARGVKLGDKVLIHAENCPEAVLAWYGCARIGAVGVTTNTHTATHNAAPTWPRHSGRCRRARRASASAARSGRYSRRSSSRSRRSGRCTSPPTSAATRSPPSSPSARATPSSATA